MLKYRGQKIPEWDMTSLFMYKKFIDDEIDMKKKEEKKSTTKCWILSKSDWEEINLSIDEIRSGVRGCLRIAQASVKPKKWWQFWK